MGFQVSDLWRSPDLNPINRKARSVPFLNPINMYGRVFFFSWFGFMIAFWAWYAIPPLLTVTIKKDLGLTSTQIANSNIVSLCATLLVRLVSGPLCDLMGPRKVFGILLFLGAIPVGLSPLIHNVSGLYTIRFFTGILGGVFVPCMVWSTGFFDKNVVGTANALTGGIGNAGGGITYFIMPAIYDSFVYHGGFSPDKAWRLTFIAPLIMVLTTAAALLLLCPDTPDGPWCDRALHAKRNLERHVISVETSETPVETLAETEAETEVDAEVGVEPDKDDSGLHFVDHEAHISRREMVDTVHGEIVVTPSVQEALRVSLSPATLVLVVTYTCSFGAELAINATLAQYYLTNFPDLGQTGAANWTAMFGFLNVVTRPLGGILADLLYRQSGRNLWYKKHWITVCGLLAGAFLVVIGRVDPHNPPTMFGLVALMAVFLEAGNGANFALVPHVHPSANGIVSGLTGAAGNLGGVLFAVVFRFMDGGTDYAKGFWVIGVIHIGLYLAVSWIPPLPKGQVGGH